MISAAARTAITQGRLSLTAVPPTGQTSLSKRFRPTDLTRQPIAERRPLRLRADHADIGCVVPAERFGGNQEIKRMIMRQDDEGSCPLVHP